MSNPLLMRRRTMMQSKKDNILTFTAEAANSSVRFIAVGTPPAITLEYNLNDGGWLPYTIRDVISLPNVGDSVKMRGNNATFSIELDNYYKFVIEGLVAASGDVTSLQNKVGGDIPLKQYCYVRMFDGMTSLTTAPELPSTTLAPYCYFYMFLDCTSLRQAPKLPATRLSDSCYREMFKQCRSLTTAIKLPATTLAHGCYFYTFSSCASVPSYDVATLDNQSTNMFSNNTSCASLTIHADTPPTIGSSTITGLKADCKIYVPYSADHSILNAYKAAQYWSARAAYIYELDENGEIPS